MLNKIFLRDPSLEAASRAEKSLYTYKRDRRDFRQYIQSQATHQYQATAKPYLHIVDGQVSYLGTLVDLIDRYEQAAGASSDEESNLIEMMAISCSRPKLLFGKSAWLKGDRTDATGKFEKAVNELYRNWASLEQKLTLCQHYIDRATKDLDRDPTSAAFTSDSDAMTHLKKRINSVYESYYYKLQACGLRNLKKPTVEEKLLYNCLEKPWLLPLAHVILVHDAQYKMKGKQKYKKEILLNGTADSLDLSSLSAKAQKGCIKATYSCAFEIRDVLQYFFASNGQSRFKTDCKAAFINYFSKKESEDGPPEMACVGGFPQMDSLMMMPTKRSKVSEARAKLSSPPFSVPSWNINHIVLRITERMQLSLNEIKTLQEVTPDLLWGTSAVETLLGNLVGISEDNKKELVSVFTSLRKLVDPKEYFSASTTDEEISKNILRHAVKLAEYVGYSRDNTDGKSKQSMEIVWHVYKYFLRFYDLTKPAMLLSRTVDTPYISKYLPNYFNFCKWDLHDNLQKYCSEKYKLKLVGVSQMNKDVCLKISTDFKYKKLGGILFQQLTGTSSLRAFNWEDAKRFLENHIIPHETSGKEKSSTLWENMFQELARTKDAGYDKLTKALVNSLKSDEKECICYVVYSELIDLSISCLEAYMMECFIQGSMNVFRQNYVSKGGNSHSNTL